MPVFTQNISSQAQASAGGKYAYPQLAQQKINSVISDEFSRETLNPTNAVAFYSTSAGSTGTATLSADSTLNITTAATNNDYVSVRTSNLAFGRTAQFIDSRSLMSFDFIINVNSAANSQYFIGIYETTSAVTALPTTARHLGMELDTSAHATWYFTSSDGTTQTTTDTTITPNASNLIRLNITVNGTNSATITLYSSTNTFTTQLATTSVSALGAADGHFYEVVFFAQALTTAAKTLVIYEWSNTTT